MSWAARDTLHLIYGKTTQFQITVYRAPMKCSQIKYSVIYRDCLTMMYPVGIWEVTLTGSWWHQPIHWELAADKFVSIR